MPAAVIDMAGLAAQGSGGKRICGVRKDAAGLPLTDVGIPFPKHDAPPGSRDTVHLGYV